MSLNVNAQEFIPQFTSNSKTDKSTKKKRSTPVNSDTSTNNNISITKSIDNHSNNPYITNNNISTHNNPYITNLNYSNNYNPNPINIQQKQLTQQQIELINQQQQEKQKQLLLIQRKATLHKLIELFPSLDCTKLETIFRTHSYNIKHSILHILQSTEFKGQFDKSICVYHLSNTCQFENNPSQCRYNHDRQVPSAICQFWLNDTCLKDELCQFIHKIPNTKNKNQKIINIDHENKTDLPNALDIQELVLMLTAMFPQHKPKYLNKLLGQHAMKIKPVVATLLQGDDYSINDTTIIPKIEKNNSKNDRPVCRYYLMGDCKLLDCMFSHDIDTANAVCKYWLWGYCSRGNKCIYKHNLPTVDTQEMINKQIQKQQQKQIINNKKTNKKCIQNKNVRKKAPSDLVAKLRLSLLKESFPDISHKILTTAFVNNGYDLEITQKYLKQKYNKKPIDVINNKQNNTINNNNNIKQNKRNIRNGKDEGLMQKIGWVETGENLNNLYKSTRNKAEEHARIRNQLFMKAVDAYLRGNRKLAKELSKKGREHDKEMHKLHKDASNDIYGLRNKKLALNVIDLHGLHVNEGIVKLNDRIAKIKKLLKNSKKRKNKKNKQQNDNQNNNKIKSNDNNNNNAYILDILTGTGHHSFGGRAKLGPAIISWAKKKKIKHKKMNFVDGRGGNIRLFIE